MIHRLPEDAQTLHAEMLSLLLAQEADVPKALESLPMGFIPVPRLDSRQASTSFRVRGKALRVDLIPPGSNGEVTPILIPRFHAAAAPIKCLSLLMREAQPAAAVDGSPATLVMVPTPARYALHKLLVSQTRSLPQATKKGKDLHRAALLLEALAEDRPQDLKLVARDFAESGPSVSRKVMRGMNAAIKRCPEARSGADIVRSELEA